MKAEQHVEDRFADAVRGRTGAISVWRDNRSTSSFSGYDSHQGLVLLGIKLDIPTVQTIFTSERNDGTWSKSIRWFWSQAMTQATAIDTHDIVRNLDDHRSDSTPISRERNK